MSWRVSQSWLIFWWITCATSVNAVVLPWFWLQWGQILPWYMGLLQEGLHTILQSVQMYLCSTKKGRPLILIHPSSLLLEGSMVLTDSFHLFRVERKWGRTPPTRCLQRRWTEEKISVVAKWKNFRDKVHSCCLGNVISHKKKVCYFVQPLTDDWAFPFRMVISRSSYWVIEFTEESDKVGVIRPRLGPRWLRDVRVLSWGLGGNTGWWRRLDGGWPKML